MIYQFIWNPQVWSKYYAGGSEIQKYFQQTVKDFDLQRFIKLSHRVDRAEWDETSGKWKITISDLVSGTQFVDEAEIFVNAMGFLKYAVQSWCSIPTTLIIGQ